MMKATIVGYDIGLSVEVYIRLLVEKFMSGIFMDMMEKEVPT